MKRYPAGSEWRKWDLHVHIPGTTQNDRYTSKEDKPDWDRFATMLEASDVAVFGITDYFKGRPSREFIARYKELFPESDKLLLTNVELRLNETVNGDTQMVDFHVIFRDSVTDAKVDEFLSHLDTQITEASGRKKTCTELATANDFKTASVTRADIQSAFERTFGPMVEPSDHLIYLAPANNNGLRAEAGNMRKAALADEIDKKVHAIFGKTASTPSYYLRADRFEDESQASKPKPVFGGCDAHSFEELEGWLGKTVEAGGEDSTHQVITWVKADPTFEGLQQTLVEPEDRVFIGPLKPDAKDDYKVISRVRFAGSKDFPEEIVFNPNLNAIIGSRSSGKSALLAHMAHAVNAEYTVQQQELARGEQKDPVGPAAGRSWKSVEKTTCTVEWADGSTTGGNILYVPQNWLYKLSESQREVTAKIRPVLESQYGEFFREYERQLSACKTSNEAIAKFVDQWFEFTEQLNQVDADIRQIGDKAAIARARDDYKSQIETLRTESELSAEDLETYQSVVNEIDDKRSRLEDIVVEIEELEPLVSESKAKKYSSVPGAVTVDTYVVPDPEQLPEGLAKILAPVITASAELLVAEVEKAIVAYRGALSAESKELTSAITRLEKDHKPLLDKHNANAALDDLVKRQKAQQGSLDRIGRLEQKRVTTVENRSEAESQVVAHLRSRGDALAAIAKSFEAEPRTLYDLSFGIAIGYDESTIRALSEPFRKNERGTYLSKGLDSDPFVDHEKAQAGPAEFMSDLFAKKQKLNQGNDPADIAKRVLVATPEIRFSAVLDEDTIGGFERSTMTPGKQALFALTLILGEVDDKWALLIDQPEDDLDSRSIYGEIVTYLVKQKKQRQIILVTHNANLVVGADAEEVLVANRHGADRKNKGGRTFDYVTGSLEHTFPLNDSAKHELDRMGIREHAVDILDGGEVAFQKRRDKYKL